MSTNINGQTVFRGNEIYLKLKDDIDVKAYNKGELLNPNADQSTVLGDRAKEIINGFISRYNPNADVFQPSTYINGEPVFLRNSYSAPVYYTEKDEKKVESIIENTVDFINWTDSTENLENAIAGNEVEDFTMIKNFKKSSYISDYKKDASDVMSFFDKNNNGLMEKEEFIQFATGGIGINGTVDNNVKEFCETMQSISITDEDLRSELGESYDSLTPEDKALLLDNTVDPKAILGENEEEISEKLKLFSSKEQEQLFGKKLDLTKSEDVEIVRKIFTKLVTNDLDTQFNNLAGLEFQEDNRKKQEVAEQKQPANGRTKLFSDTLSLDNYSFNKKLNVNDLPILSIDDIERQKVAKTTISAEELRGALLAADYEGTVESDGKINANGFDGKISYKGWSSLGSKYDLVKACYFHAKDEDAKVPSKTEEQKAAELKAQVKDVTSKIQQYYQYKDKEVKETGNNNVNNNGMSFYQINNKRNMFFNGQYALVDGKFVMVDNSTPEGQARLEISSLLRQNKFTEQDLGITNTYGTYSKYNNDLQKSYQDTALKNYNTEMTRIKTELKDVKGLNLLISEIESQKSAIKKEDYQQLNQLTAKIRNLNINSVTGGNNMRNEWFSFGNWSNSASALSSITAGKDYKLVSKNGEIVKESTVKQTETAKVAQPATDTFRKRTVAVNIPTAKKTPTPTKTPKKVTTPAGPNQKANGIATNKGVGAVTKAPVAPAPTVTTPSYLTGSTGNRVQASGTPAMPSYLTGNTQKGYDKNQTYNISPSRAALLGVKSSWNVGNVNNTTPEGQKLNDRATYISNCASKQGKSDALSQAYKEVNKTSTWTTPGKTVMVAKISDKQIHLKTLEELATSVGVVF